MLKKLISGELSLGDTFWKFGILGMIVVVFVVRLFAALLASKLSNISLWVYYTQYFKPLHMNSGILILTVCYLVSLAVFIWYAVMMLSGTWKSSSKYDKSIWLRHVSRWVMAGWILLCGNFVF